MVVMANRADTPCATHCWACVCLVHKERVTDSFREVRRVGISMIALPDRQRASRMMSAIFEIPANTEVR